MWKSIFLAAALPVLLSAQMPHGFWWEGKVAKDLNLTEAQQKQISSIGREYSSKLFQLREAQRTAEGDLAGVFDETPVDQHKWNDAINRLTAAREELFRATSQMEFNFRSVLTAEQWAQLKERSPRGGPGGRGPGGPDGMHRRGGSPTKGTGPISQQPQYK
jgi:Spy/CpxP family protein refolding chaperone